MDYGKFKYQQRKKEKEARKHQKELKEIRLTPQMSEHDLLYRLKNAEEFLREGHRVRVFMQIVGRWAAHMDLGEAKLREFAERLSHVGVVESPLSHQGKMISITLAPRKDAKQKPAAPTVSPVKPAEAQPSQTAQPIQPTQASSPQVSEVHSEPEPQVQETPKVIEVVSDDRGSR
jgi:translation initiation factor IF-3